MLELAGSEKTRVLTPSNIKTPCSVSTTALGMLTLALCICADSTALKPTCILPLKTLPPDLDHLADKFEWGGQSSGWMTQAIFADWVKSVFVPHVQEKRKQQGEPDAEVILWVDGHSSRAAVDAVSHLHANNIHLVTIPSHTSHVLQPLDRGVNAVFKRYMQPHQCLEVGTSAQRRVACLESALNALYHAQAPRTIIGSFKCAGIVPWDKGIIVNDPTLVRQQVEPVDATPRKKRKRNAVNISGRLITGDECRKELEEAKETKTKNNQSPNTKKGDSRSKKKRIVVSDDDSEESRD